MDVQSLAGRIEFRLSPLVDLALAGIVLASPERFQGGPPDWAPVVRRRLPPRVIEALERADESADLLDWALVQEERGASAEDVLNGQGPASLTDRSLERSLFSQLWTVLAPQIAARAARAAARMNAEAARLAELGPAAWVTSLSDRVGLSSDGSALVLHWGGGMRVPLEEIERVVVVVSPFCPRRLMFYRRGRTQWFFLPPAPEGGAGPGRARGEAPGAAGEGAGEEPPDPPEALVLALAALADPTRLTILRLIAGGRRTGQEIARLVGLNESTVSRHLRLLVEAECATRERGEGKSIVHRPNVARFRGLCDDLLAYLEVRP